jgi:Domain of unknown function (DUF4203)
MSDFVLGVLAILVGALFCFRGYLAMRLIIPIWGAFAGFLFGAGLIASITGDGFLGTVLGWAVGFAFALLFAALAYFYYEICIVIGMAAIGFALGTSLMVALGVTWSWLIVLAGAALGVVLAFAAIVSDMPMLLLTILTALAGASTVVTGIMLLGNTLSTDSFEEGATTKAINDSWWWWAIYVVLAIAGIIAQVRTTDRLRASMRASWSDSGGRYLRAEA